MNATYPSTIQRLQAYSDLELPLVLKRLRRLFRIRKDCDGELTHIPISDPTLSQVHTLLRRSYDRPLDVRTAIPWDLGVDRDRPAKVLSQLWMCGTPFGDSMTERQRIELSWLEIARDVSWLIKLKESTSALYMGYLNQYKRSLPPVVQDYLLVVAKEEIVHALMFKRFMSVAGLPAFTKFPVFGHIAALLPEMHPCVGILGQLIPGWIIHAGAMFATQSAAIEALTREVFNLHHVDKARHLDFSRRMVEDYFSDAPRQERQRVRQMFRQIIKDMLASYRFSSEVARHTSFEFPIDTTKRDLVKAIRESMSNTRLDDARFAELMNWLWTMDLI